jgi:DNA-binding transcriptional ArsR family regulator
VQRLFCRPMEGSIPELLGGHQSLAYEQIAARLNESPAVVRAELQKLREQGLVASFGIGQLEGTRTNAVSYWRLTWRGSLELARRRAA